MTINKKMIALLVLVLSFNLLLPITVGYAAQANILQTLSAATLPNDSSSGGLINSLFSFLFDNILGPLLHLGGSSTTGSAPIVIPPAGNSPVGSLPDGSSGTGALKGKVIVVDPGHGGSNPGAVANGTRESDNNLAVALKLQEKLTQAGARVIMSRSQDRTVAPEGSSLTEELAARVALAESNHADLFISIHSNDNNNSAIQGATTFYNTAQSSQVAFDVQNGLVAATGANDKGTSQANYYVIRNPSMPSILVEMGFVSNASEAAKLNNDAYRNKIATGISNGIVHYFNDK